MIFSVNELTQLPTWRFLAIAWLMLGCTAQAQDSRPSKLFIDTSLYPYLSSVDNDVDATVTARAILPGRFSYFGYANMKGVVTDGSAVFDRSEQNLRYSITEKLPLDLNLQGVFAKGDGNDFYQVGVGWRVNDTSRWSDFFDRNNLIYRLTVQLKQFNTGASGVWAVEHWFLWRMNKISDRLYLNGFIDQTFGQGLPESMPSSPIVAELQLGARVWKDFYAVAEYRINQRRVGDEENLAIGIEYKARW
jgi:hypothetical protein